MTQENGPKHVATKEGREEKVGRPKEGGPRGGGEPGPDGPNNTIAFFV